ncbi:MAG: hypothetical protein J6R44_03330, partial [Clostridia bacterium]|nr:hypothetical protein [Clostridia bacterium]
MKNKIFAILVTLLLVAVISISVFACNDNSSTTPPPTQEGGDKLPSTDENEPVEDVVPLQITSTTFEINGL